MFESSWISEGRRESRCLQGRSRRSCLDAIIMWRWCARFGGCYRVVSREISGAADVVWGTEKGDSCDPFTQDDAGGTPAPQLFRDHNSQVLAVRNCVRSPLWQAARSARTQRAAKLSSLPAPRAQ